MSFSTFTIYEVDVFVNHVVLFKAVVLTITFEKFCIVFLLKSFKPRFLAFCRYINSAIVY